MKHKTTAELQTLFDLYSSEILDEKNQKQLDFKGFSNCFVELNLKYSDVELKKIMITADTDNSGFISFGEFRKLFDAANLKKVFTEIDADNSGSITEGELFHALVSMHIHVTKKDVKKMIAKVDQNSDGLISFDEFVKIFGNVPNATLEGVARAWIHNAGTDVGTDLAPPIPPKDLPLYQFLLAGGFGGMSSRTATAPLERIKIQAQMGKNTGLLRELSNIVSKEGIYGLWAGNFTNCLRVFPFAGLSCVFYSRFVKYLPCDNELDPMEPVWRAIAGGMAGICASTITYPLDIIRARQTVAGNNSAGILRTANQIMAKEGIRALYRGLQPTLFAVAPFIGLQQASYDLYKQLFIDSGYFKPSLGLFLGCGAVAGLTAQAIVYPLDVVRRRIQLEKIPSKANIQNTKPNTGQGIRLYTWLALQSVVAEGGAKSLYSGIFPTMLKVAPAVAVSVVVRDFILGRLD
jgi:solute carrier family 25 (mitochondrial phosphate transporter), member 23/24/25/41